MVESTFPMLLETGAWVCVRLGDKSNIGLISSTFEDNASFILNNFHGQVFKIILLNY
jgi:hypothetical protein